MKALKWLMLFCAMCMIVLIGFVVLLNLITDRQVNETAQNIETVSMSEAPVNESSMNTGASASALPSISDYMISDYDTEENVNESDEDLSRVSLQVSVIAKDIKIKILEENGKRWQGVPWRIELCKETKGVLEETASGNNVSAAALEYTDEDHDGIIRVENLKTGKYGIRMLPAQDAVMLNVKLPEDEVKVRIRDNISYTVIQDILSEIKPESEIDVAIEDTGQNDEVDEGVTHALGRVGSYGIDVSKWNKEIDWQQVKDSGVEYAIIRCGYRGASTGALVEDPFWKKNFEGARAAGVKVGVYFFTQAISEAEAIEEASMVTALLGGEAIEYPVFLDVEGSGGRADALDASDRTKMINAFLETIRNQGYQSGVYANKNWFTNKILTDELKPCIRWLAQYNVTEPDYKGNYHIWQYSSKGHVAGIDGFVDVNQSFLSQN